MTAVPPTPAPSARYLLDTNILVAYIRAGPLGQHIERTYSLRAAALRPLVCVVSVGEILAFARKRGWGSQRVAAMHALLSQFPVVDIHPSDVLDAYAALDHAAESTGVAVGQNDLWIAAATTAARATLLTTDRDFIPLAPGRFALDWIVPARGRPTTP